MAYFCRVPPRDRTRRRIHPRQQRAQLTVDSILTAAERVMVKDGYAKTTTNRIAEVAGVKSHSCTATSRGRKPSWAR
ncbi:TetR family transcriptional regulator [Myxococcus sp. Y35]|uniref:TetR family transcriptional regulator n=1 Tax=Pseudomyxococcus flavus TaxID=3115648 RepID=UPI003CF92AE5